MARPPPLPSNCPDSTRRKRFMHRLRWQPWSSLVRPDRPRYDHLPQEGLIRISTKVITVLARRKSKSTGNTVLFVGASDAGKTAILSSVSRQLPLHTLSEVPRLKYFWIRLVQLAFHQQPPTHASLQTNSSLITLPNVKQPVQAVDIPGHPRIRVQYRDHFNDAKAIVFVVDASTVSRNGAAVAECVLFPPVFHFPMD
jgi:hypothetical protein